MAFTFDPGTKRGKVRLLVADTDSGNQIFSDAEIDAFLNLNNNGVLSAAADAARSVAASTAKSAIAYRVLSQALDIDKRQVPEHYRQIASQYETKARQGPVEEIDSMDHAYDVWGRRVGELVGERV